MPLLPILYIPIKLIFFVLFMMTLFFYCRNKYKTWIRNLKFSLAWVTYSCSALPDTLNVHRFSNLSGIPCMVWFRNGHCSFTFCTSSLFIIHSSLSTNKHQVHCSYSLRLAWTMIEGTPPDIVETVLCESNLCADLNEWLLQTYGSILATTLVVLQGLSYFSSLWC